MPPLNGQGSNGRTGQDYWRSLDHLADTPEFRAFMHREFPAGASEMLDSGERRHFLKIMGASMALAGIGMAGCRRWPEEHIAPYADRPEGRDPGVAARYATCMDLGGVAAGLLVTSSDGRPTKIEGNPEHPAARGAADIFAQGSILGLYDPDRSRNLLHDGAPATWGEFAGWATDHFDKLRAKRGAGLAILSEASSSPTVAAMKRRVMERFPNATWHEYEPINNDAVVAGAEMAFGSAYRTHIDLEAARVIVSLDDDLLGPHANAVPTIRGFARSRRVDDHHDMSRLYVFESDYSLTGANADERAAVRSSDVPVIAIALAAAILGDDRLTQQLASTSIAQVLTSSVRRHVENAVSDLKANRGHGVITAGSRQSAGVHYLVHRMNEALGNVKGSPESAALGRGAGTVAYTPQRDQVKHGESIAALAAAKVETLVIIGGNPVYNAPADLDFAEVLGKAKSSIHLSESADETSVQCTWHVNRAHYLEAWGDGRAWDGTFSVGQPLILPLFGGRSSIELLALMAGDELAAGQALVRRTFDEMLGGADEPRWRQTLHDGFLPGSAYTLEAPRVNASTLTAAAEALVASVSAAQRGWELVFAPHPSLYDGRYANNGWMQEVPAPMTKLTWDNAVLMGPASATELGVETGDMVRVTVGERSVDAAALILPGIARASATLHLGYGRAFVGAICTGAGFDFQRLRTTTAMGIAARADLAPTGEQYDLVTTQDHHTIDPDSVGGRGVQDRLPTLFREATLEEYREHPGFASHRVHVVHRLSQWEESNLDDGRFAWALSVDLNSCVGCGACIVACQAENNIPIVGKDQVARGREMHWMRIDRYFKFGRDDDGYDPDDVEAVALQPVMCMMCENAPCEQVCPVAATVHDSDGLNVMVYNRCVGTRYCSNNCPYKVRRFNYFDYHRRNPYREQPGALLQVDTSYFERPQATPEELLRLQLNPEVTVRMRGVMEKCTYCVQRIADAKIHAKNAFARLPEDEKAALEGVRVEVPDGTITPACAQTCPAEALVFGDLMDTDSRVARLQRAPRSYQMLEELNVDARTKYMAKVRNPVDGGAGHGTGHGTGHGGGEGQGGGHEGGGSEPGGEDHNEGAHG